MQILPEETMLWLAAEMQETVNQNLLILMGVIGLATAILLIMGWFKKSHNRIEHDSFADWNDDYYRATGGRHSKL